MMIAMQIAQEDVCPKRSHNLISVCALANKALRPQICGRAFVPTPHQAASKQGGRRSESE